MVPQVASRRAQRGVALMALLAIAVMVFAYVLTSRLNAASRFVGIDREHNAMVMAQAKRALIGWMAINAAGTDLNPGRLPCPEAPGYFGDPAQEGIAAGSCTLPAVGRLPWRTLGLDKPVDAAGEALWYVVSTGWALPCTSAPTSLTCKTNINSDSPGQLALDGVANDVVALIIAPGPAIRDGCSGFVQSRPTAGPPNVANYLECGNALGNYVTSSPGNTFNDQVLRVAAADVIPALEAAIADRMQQEIAPVLRTVYASASWGTSAANPLYPFAARFDLPHPGTSGYRGEDGRYQGLLPFNSASATCGADPRCTANFVTWNTGVGPTVTASGGVIVSSTCNFPNASTAQCSGVFAGLGTVTLTMSTRADNVAMALRALNMTVEYGLLAYGPPGPVTSAAGTFNTDGSADLTLNADVPGLGIGTNILFRLTAVIADHALLDPADPTTGWFVRNEWYRLVYYAAAWKSTADGASPYDCQPANCLKFNGAGRNIRALLVLAGQRLSNQAVRPNGNPVDYLEYQNAIPNTTQYEQRPARTSKIDIPAIYAPFNDRVILVDWLNIAPVEPTQVFKQLAPWRIATMP